MWSNYGFKIRGDMKFKEHEIEMLVEMSDPDGAWSIFRSMGLQEECEYIETKYFNNEKLGEERVEVGS